jgi:hypothetical protein
MSIVYPGGPPALPGRLNEADHDAHARKPYETVVGRTGRGRRREADGYDKPTGYQSSIFHELTGTGAGGPEHHKADRARAWMTARPAANYDPIQVYTCDGTNAQHRMAASGNTLQVPGKCPADAAGTAGSTTSALPGGTPPAPAFAGRTPLSKYRHLRFLAYAAVAAVTAAIGLRGPGRHAGRCSGLVPLAQWTRLPRNKT